MGMAVRISNHGSVNRVAWRRALLPAALFLAASALTGQPREANYDESRVPRYDLPPILLARDGTAVQTPDQWAVRRAEILGTFEDQVYGLAPPAPPGMRFTELEEATVAVGVRAVRKQVRIAFPGGEDGLGMDLLLYTPAAAEGPVAVFAGLNFGGNQTVSADPDVPVSSGWMRSGDGVVDHRATPATRGQRAARWQLERILRRGYGLVTAYYGDLDPDFDDGYRNGVHSLAPPRTKGEWGSIAAWAWGLSRMLDYLETDPDADSSRVAVIGHSRLGKAALWAGARDQRFAMVISNNSGCGGAALSRRRYGETVERINARFPHWFAGNFKAYGDREDHLPVDQHMLLALIAPRPLYVASAADDRWADPKGEFLSAMHAGSVYELHGRDGLGVARQPAPDQPLAGTVGYHVRSGGHDVTAYDWNRFLDFADRHLGRE